MNVHYRAGGGQSMVHQYAHYTYQASTDLTCGRIRCASTPPDRVSALRDGLKPIQTDINQEMKTIIDFFHHLIGDLPVDRLTSILGKIAVRQQCSIQRFQAM